MSSFIRPAISTTFGSPSDAQPVPLLPAELSHGLARAWRAMPLKLTLPLLALIISTLVFFLGERNPVADGISGDGESYAELTRKSPVQVLTGGANAYFIQRVVPSIVAHRLLKAVSLEITNKNIVLAFGIINIVCLTLIAFLWTRIADLLHISRNGQWLGFVGLFLNVAIMKVAGFSPVMTDLPACLIGTAMLYCFLARRPLSLAAVTFVGAFTWPTAVYAGAVLLAFPRSDAAPKPSSRSRFPFHLLIVTPLALLCGFRIWQLLKSGYLTAQNAAAPIQALNHLSILVTVAFVLFALGKVFHSRRLYDLRHWRYHLRRRNFYLACAFLGGMMWLTSALAGGTHDFSYKTFLDRFLFCSIHQPGVFLVAHAVYFGPVIILAYLLWSRICGRVHEFGIGLTLTFAMGTALAIFSESRCLIHFLPFVIPFTIRALEDVQGPARCGTAMTLLGLLFSKFWLTFGSAPWAGCGGSDLGFPPQLYNMNYGPWMSHLSYWIQGGAVLATAAILYTLHFLQPRLLGYRSENVPFADEAAPTPGPAIPEIGEEKLYSMLASTPSAE